MAIVRLVKFGSKTCSACAEMAKAKTLEKFKARFPEVRVVSLDVTDDEGESPTLAESSDGVDYRANYALSDDYGVEALPTLVFEVEGAGEVARIDGAASVRDLSEAYEEILEVQKRASKLPWSTT